LSVAPEIVSLVSVDEKLIISPATGFPDPSVTVAVAVEVDTPLAVIVDGWSANAIFAAGPGVWVSVWGADGIPATLAVIDACPAVVELVIVAV
jgi:hypothetical protein